MATKTASQPHTTHFDDVFNEELNRMGKKGGEQLVGLGISGGGIRSASFGLGVLQALHRYKKIVTLDYLSSVSGGGYVASSLTWFRYLDKGGSLLGKLAPEVECYTKQRDQLTAARPLGAKIVRT